MKPIAKDDVTRLREIRAAAFYAHCTRCDDCNFDKPCMGCAFNNASDTGHSCNCRGEGARLRKAAGF